jgi:hypothetical protein
MVSYSLLKGLKTGIFEFVIFSVLAKDPWKTQVKAKF